MNCYFSSAAEWVPSISLQLEPQDEYVPVVHCKCKTHVVLDGSNFTMRSDCPKGQTELMTCIPLVVQPCVLVNVMMGWETVDRKDTSVFSDSLQFTWAHPVEYLVKQIHTFCDYFCVWKKVVPCLSFSEPAISKETGNTMPGTQVGLPRPMACLLQNEAVVK